MTIVEVYSNTFFSCIKKADVKSINIVNSRGNFVVLFPSICNLIKRLILNISETIER